MGPEATVSTQNYENDPYIVVLFGRPQFVVHHRLNGPKLTLNTAYGRVPHDLQRNLNLYSLKLNIQMKGKILCSYCH